MAAENVGLRDRRSIAQFGLAVVALVATVPVGWWIAAEDSDDSPQLVFVVTMALLAVAITFSGRSVTGRWLGALIDQRRKFSLSRLQIVLWTIVIVSAVFSLALARAQADPNDLFMSTSGEPTIDANQPTPGRLEFEIPIEVWALLGISATTLVAAGIVKQDNATKGRLHFNEPTEVGEAFEEASIIDLISGEEESTRGTLDMGKLQAIFFTVLVAFVYAAAVWESYGGAIGDIAGLPALEDGLIALIGISHGGYIVGKAVPSGGGSTAPNGGDAVADGPQTANG